MELVILALLWAGWCALHSLLISLKVVEALRAKLGDRYRFYRLFFNIASVLTLIPVLWYGSTLRGPVLFHWAGPSRVFQVLLIAVSLALFYAGARHYDTGQLLGLRQIREHGSSKGLTDTGGLDTRGILGVVRHPWYTAAMLIIWARPLDASVLVTNVVLTAYLIIGTRLEEAKLIHEFGDSYRDYQRKVPMFWPRLFRKGPGR